jgi:alkyl hydroperoxide reductase subunit AhpF
MERLAREQRRSIHAQLVRTDDPVHLLIFTRDTDQRGSAARHLGLELQALSRNVHLELHDVDANPLLAARYGVAQTPAFALFTGGVAIADRHIRFYGLPEGPVLEALVAGIVATSRGAAAVTAADRRVQWLDRPVHLDVYVPCPAAADSRALLRLQRLTLLAAQLSLDIVIGDDCPAWTRRSGRTHTMPVVVNGAIVAPEGWSLQQLVDALVAATYGEPERLDLESQGRVLVAGMRPMGASLANGALTAGLTTR